MACLLYRSTSRYNSLRPYVLVALSLFFYSTWNPLYCLPITITALLDYNTSWLLVRITGARKRSLLIGTDIILNLIILAIFKYFNFLHQGATPSSDTFLDTRSRPRPSALCSWWEFRSTRSNP